MNSKRIGIALGILIAVLGTASELFRTSAYELIGNLLGGLFLISVVLLFFSSTRSFAKWYLISFFGTFAVGFIVTMTIGTSLLARRLYIDSHQTITVPDTTVNTIDEDSNESEQVPLEPAPNPLPEPEPERDPMEPPEDYQIPYEVPLPEEKNYNDPSISKVEGEIRIQLDETTTIKMKDNGDEIFSAIVNGYKTYYYGELIMSKDVHYRHRESPFYKPYTGLVYACNGPLLEDILHYRPYQDCSTNGNNFLTQYEMSTLFIPGEFALFSWYKLYVKKVNEIDLIIKADLKGEKYDATYDGSEIGYYRYSQKTVWEKMMKDPENQSNIKKWDEIVESLSVL